LTFVAAAYLLILEFKAENAPIKNSNAILASILNWGIQELAADTGGWFSNIESLGMKATTSLPLCSKYSCSASFKGINAESYVRYWLRHFIVGAIVLKFGFEPRTFYSGSKSDMTSSS
jgi:hypothetical protein